MYFYHAFGHILQSEFPIGGLQSAHAGNSDFIIKYGDISSSPTQYSKGEGACEYCSDDVHLQWGGFGSIRVQAGRYIAVNPILGAQHSVVCHAVLGPAMAVALYQRGYYVLHASAVNINDTTVAFAGWKGHGKSTTAAALYHGGHELVTDDLLAIDTDKEHVAIAMPGIPMLKLWDDSVEMALSSEPQSLPIFQPKWPKRTLWTSDETVATERELRIIYVLESTDDNHNRDQITIDALGGHQAFVELMRHAYVPRLIGSDFSNRHHMFQVSSLLKNVSVRRLCRSRSFRSLAKLVARIEHDVIRQASSTESY